MIKDDLKIETEASRFLLGEMSETEQSAFEERFVADEDLFEQVRVVEDELIESYVREILPAAEREKFERSFLSSERRRNRVAFTRTMLGKLGEQKQVAVAKNAEIVAPSSSLWDSIASFFKTPIGALGTACAFLILIFGGWLLTRTANETEIVRQNTTTTPTIQTTGTIEPPANENVTVNANVSVRSNANAPDKTFDNKNSVRNANKETPNKNQNAITPKSTAVQVAPVLALFAGTVRAEGRISELNLPEGASGANLLLNLESEDYKIYRIEIVNPDGKSVFQKNNLKAGNSKINLLVPAAKLPRGDYTVKLSALNPQNESESVADYNFRVNRK